MVNASDFRKIPVGPAGWQRIKDEADRLSKDGRGLNSRTNMAGKRDNKHAASGPAGELAVDVTIKSLYRCSEEHCDFVAPSGDSGTTVLVV